MKKTTRMTAVLTAVFMLAALLPAASFAVPGDAGLSEYTSGGDVTDVRDQGTGDVSYAFATMYAAEIAIDGDDELSPQHMRFAMSKSESNSLGFVDTTSSPLLLSANVTYNARNAIAAYLMRGKMGGIVTEEHDPYNVTRSQSATDGKLRSYRANDIIYIDNMPDKTPNYYAGNAARQKHVDDLKNAIANYGAVTGWIYSKKTTSAKIDPGLWWNGDTFESAGHLNSTQSVVGNLCVTAVGWDDNYVFDYDEKNEVNQPTEKGAFYIKSSWGEDIGEDGYFYLSYQDTLLLKDAFALNNVKSVFDDDYPVEFIYEHDALGRTGEEMNNSSFLANVFTVEQNSQEVHSVSFAVADANTNYEVYMLTGIREDDSITDALDSLGLSGQQPLTSGTIAAPGYYTVQMDSPVSLGNKGEKIAVVVRYSGCTYIPLEKGKADAGQTYQSNGTSGKWNDISASGFNACVKLIAANAEEVRPSGVALTIGVSEITDLLVGQTRKLSYTVEGGPLVNDAVAWSSSDPTVVRVDSAGNITALKAGRSTITVTTVVGGHDASVDVIVPEVPVDSIKINKTSTAEKPYELKTNAAVALSVTITPANASNKEILWTSSDESIATVTSLGKVTGVAPGTAVITASVAETTGSSNIITAEFYVNVSKDYVTGISLSKKTITMGVGSVLPFKITVNPSTAYITDLDWELTSGEDDIVKFSDDYTSITALKPGRAEYTITAKDYNPDKKVPTATLSITVTNLADSYVNVGRSITLTSALSGSKSEDLEWEIAEIDENGDEIQNDNLESKVTFTPNKNKAKVVGVAVGQFKVTVTDKTDANKFQVIKVFVKMPVKKVTVMMEGDTAKRPAKKKELTINQDGSMPSSVQLVYTIGPDDATYKDVIWSSSKPGVATVSDTGVVTAVGVGSAKITCKSASDNAKATFSISVKYNPENFNLNKTGLQQVEVGRKLGLKVAFEKVRNISKTVIWSSDNPDVATVTKTGSVKLVGAGTATITATVAGGKSESIMVEGCITIKKIVPVQKRLTLEPGTSYTLTATVTPTDTTYPELVYKSSKPGVATVDEATGEITAISKGSTTITVSAKVGKAKKSVVVKVT